ncbi:MAG: hypothetical protein J1F33_05580 [Clostridiales bacterium]|nr:hypothetical protein [Clostridiales bacterium]
MAKKNDYDMFLSFLDDIESQHSLEETETEDRISTLDDRDKKYSDLLENYNQYYIEKSKSNIGLRKCFFWFSFGLLSVMILGMIATAILLCVFVQNYIAVGVGIVSSLGASVTSILILPRIIGNYLFPSDEDKHIRDVIYKMRDADEHRFDTHKDKTKH